jgi:hypothetical protein
VGVIDYFVEHQKLPLAYFISLLKTWEDLSKTYESIKHLAPDQWNTISLHDLQDNFSTQSILSLLIFEPWFSHHVDSFAAKIIQDDAPQYITLTGTLFSDTFRDILKQFIQKITDDQLRKAIKIAYNKALTERIRSVSQELQILKWLHLE